MADGEGITQIVNKDQAAAADAGKPTSAMASKAVAPEEMQSLLDSIGKIAAMDLKDNKGRVDAPPVDGKPQGRLDIMLVRLMEDRTDRNNVAFRLVDKIESEGDRAWLAHLCVRRFVDKDRRITAREVQKVVDICEAVGLPWRSAHGAAPGSNIRLEHVRAGQISHPDA